MRAALAVLALGLLASSGCIPSPPEAAPAAGARPVQSPVPAVAAAGGDLVHVDFEGAPIGPYAPARAAADFGAASHFQGFAEGRAAVVATEQGRALRILYPHGSVGPEEGGAQFMVSIPGAHDELYCAYRVRFAAGFDFVRGGKLPGLVGGTHPTGGHPDDGGFSARLMWRTGGAAVQYVYFPRQTTTYGVDLPYVVAGTPARFQPGTWHRVEHRVVMNTPGQANGVLQAWIDGQPALDLHDRVWRLDASVHVDALYFSTFFGGNDPSWGARRDESVDFDDFVVSTHPIGH